MSPPRMRWAIFLAGSMQLSCGSSDTPPAKTVARETAELEISRISSVWISTEIDKTILSPPSPLSLSASTRTSTLFFEPGAVRETLSVEEVLDLRSGGRVRCRTHFDHEVGFRFGRKEGEAAVELLRPALSSQRGCDGNAPEPVLAEAARRVLLVLRSDQLVAIEPPLDQRVYRPSSK